MRRLGKGRFRLFRGQKGLTLIEVLVAVGILSIIGTTVIRSLDTNYRAVRVLDQQVVADNLITAYLEAIKQGTYADNYTSATANIVLSSQYNVVIKTYGTDNFTGSDNSTTWVGPPSSGQTFQKIILEVSQGGKPILSIYTYRAKR